MRGLVNLPERYIVGAAAAMSAGGARVDVVSQKGSTGKREPSDGRLPPAAPFRLAEGV